jgi:hypothetical protein
MCNPNSFHRRQLSGERDHTEMYSEVISAGRAGNRERQSEVIREAIRGSSEGPSV